MEHPLSIPERPPSPSGPQARVSRTRAAQRLGLEADWSKIVAALAAEHPLPFSREMLAVLNHSIRAALSRYGASVRDAWPDLCQQVLMRLVNAAKTGNLRDPQALPRFIAVVTRNELFSWARTSRRRQPEALTHDPEAHVPDQPEEHLPAEAALHLGRALQLLDKEPRTLLQALYWRGMTYAELAKEHRTSPATIKRRRAAAIAALSEQLK